MLAGSTDKHHYKQTGTPMEGFEVKRSRCNDERDAVGVGVSQGGCHLRQLLPLLQVGATSGETAEKRGDRSKQRAQNVVFSGR